VLFVTLCAECCFVGTGGVPRGPSWADWTMPFRLFLILRIVILKLIFLSWRWVVGFCGSDLRRLSL